MLEILYSLKVRLPRNARAVETKARVIGEHGGENKRSSASSYGTWVEENDEERMAEHLVRRGEVGGSVAGDLVRYYVTGSLCHEVRLLNTDRTGKLEGYLLSSSMSHRSFMRHVDTE